jgi:hypothetical protein
MTRSIEPIGRSARSQCDLALLFQVRGPFSTYRYDYDRTQDICRNLKLRDTIPRPGSAFEERLLASSTLPLVLRLAPWCKNVFLLQMNNVPARSLGTNVTLISIENVGHDDQHRYIIRDHYFLKKSGTELEIK